MVSRIFKPIHPSPIHALAALALTLVCTPVNGAVTTAQGLTCADMEEFLKFGKIGVQKSIPKGVTLPRRATLEYKGLQHDAAIQTVDISRTEFRTATTVELNFHDSWKYNVAGYKLAKIL